MMNQNPVAPRNDDFRDRLSALWHKAIHACKHGHADPVAWANEDDGRFLESVGIRPSEVYDFAEDYVDEGVPSLETFLRIHELRRNYFLEVQKGHRSQRVIDPDTLPPKPAAVAGFTWLPRIIRKAEAKLRGELPPSIMYGCGGDRAFLHRHGIKAEDFLRVVWEQEHNEDGIVDWVAKQTRQSQPV